jgi:hypothetical protein
VRRNKTILDHRELSRGGTGNHEIIVKYMLTNLEKYGRRCSSIRLYNRTGEKELFYRKENGTGAGIYLKNINQVKVEGICKTSVI